MIGRKIYLDKIKSFKDKDIIKVLTGIRRCGKSVILKLLIEDLKKENIKKSLSFFRWDTRSWKLGKMY